MGNNNTQSGLVLALGAFGLWGLIPIYFKLLESVSPLEVLGHRVLWSSVLLVAFLAVRGRLGELRQLFLSPRTLGFLLLSSLLIAANWLCFIWGVTNGRILETSLGYYINPLMNVLFGALFLGERLRRFQAVAVCLAAVAVAYQITLLGTVPWIAFVLAMCFAFYGLIRKTLGVNATAGLAVETLLLLPGVVGYFLWLLSRGELMFSQADAGTGLLLMLAGVITTVPLVFFNMAAQKLTLTTIGIMQYLAPSISLVVGVVIYNEPLGHVQMVTFGLIWIALVIFTLEGIARQKRQLKSLGKSSHKKGGSVQPVSSTARKKVG